MQTNTPANPLELTDRLGRTWDLTITVAAARRIDRTDFSIVTNKRISIMVDNNQLQDVFQELLTNLNLTLAFIFRIIEPQLKDKIGSDPKYVADALMGDGREEIEEAFMEGFDGNTISVAKQVLWEALMDFFPEQRTILSTAWRSYHDGLQKVMKRVEAMSPELQEKLDQMLTTKLDNLREESLTELEKELGGVFAK
ncbi:MAG: hypothetical protein ACWGQW_06200 [bacterium]